MRDECDRQLDKTSPFLEREALDAPEICKDVQGVSKQFSRSVR